MNNLQNDYFAFLKLAFCIYILNATSCSSSEVDVDKKLTIAASASSQPSFQPRNLQDTTSTKLALVTPKTTTISSDTLWKPKEFTELRQLSKTIAYDIRYATANNFVSAVMYDCPACYLRPEVAKAIVEIHEHLRKQHQMGLKMFDCYRPRSVQWKLWNKVPNPSYVADPRKGSMHNRGSAVDLTIVDESGKELEMGTEYDFFGKEAYHEYTNLPKKVLENRKLLLTSMQKFGFRPTRTEWWHYSYKQKSYPLADEHWPCPRKN